MSVADADHASWDPGGMEFNLGQLLIDFFKLYGRDLDPERVGISCR